MINTLGTPHEVQDQGYAMQLAALGWLSFMPLVWLEDFTPIDSVFSGIGRFGAFFMILMAVIALNFALPKSLNLPKNLSIVIALLALALQFLCAREQLAVFPQIDQVLTALVISHALMIAAAVPLAYCFYRHPLFPNWIAVGIVLDCIFWTGYYWIATEGLLIGSPTEYAVIPFILFEVSLGIIGFRAGAQMQSYAFEQTLQRRSSQSLSSPLR